MKTYLTRKEVAERYPFTVGQLARWATNDMGPPYVLCGKALYSVEELEAWIEEGKIHPCPKAEGRPRRPGRPLKVRTRGGR